MNFIKKCRTCGVEKPLKDYYIRTPPNVLRNDCKKCCMLLTRNSRRAYYLKHLERIKKRNLKYRKSHKKERNLQRRNRRKKDINYKILTCLTSRIDFVLRLNRQTKKTMELLGCDINSFKKYLESKFQSGMNWENYGFYGWHIDHIKPCSSFDLSNPKEQIKCFHYTNLQPLWAKDNLTKHAKFNHKV